MALYSEKIEGLIDAALADGVLTEKEKQILFKKAQAEGIDLDEFEMVLDARLVELEKKRKAVIDTAHEVISEILILHTIGVTSLRFPASWA